MSFLSQGAFLQQTAARVKALRLASSSTQADFAERASIALPTYRVFERTGRISLERLYRIAVTLGRVSELASLFPPPPFASIEQLVQPAGRKRGRRKAAPAS